MSGVRITGKIKNWFEDRGFGFIRPDEGGEEVFVHRTDLSGSLEMLIVDHRVSYELVDNVRKGNGKKAANVELA